MQAALQANSPSQGRMHVRIHCSTPAGDPPEGEIHAVVGTLTTTSWTRARHSFGQGPPPLRSAEWPWGFPWLGKPDRDTVDAANKEVEALVSKFHEFANDSPSTRLLFLHPEDLGIGDRGRPASPWQLPTVRELARTVGMHRLAFFQCEFGPFRAAAPTGLLTCSPIHSAHFKKGWPLFHGVASHHYVGPLGRKCNCANDHHPWSTISAELHHTRGYTKAFNPSFLSWLALYLMRDRWSAVELLRTGIASTVHTDSGDETWGEDLPQDFAPTEHYDQLNGNYEASDDEMQHSAGEANSDGNNKRTRSQSADTKNEAAPGGLKDETPRDHLDTRSKN